MDQVKQWCDLMKNEENELLGKERIDESDLEKKGSSAAKETTDDTGNDYYYEWTRESEDKRLLSRSDLIQHAFNNANAQSSRYNKTSILCTNLTTSLGLQSADEVKSSQPPVLMANAEGVVKVDSKQMPNLASGLDVMSQEESIIELDLSSIGKISVKGSSTMQDEHTSSAQALKRSNSEIHIDDKRYKCDTCGKTFQYKSKLNCHLLIHTGEKAYKCEFCEKGFNLKCNLNKHKREMHFNKVCTVRQNDFDDKQDMINHLVMKQSDIDERPHKCKTCPATFKRLQHLKYHTEIHTGEKPYVCEICNKAFTLRCTLIKHKYTHSDIKPHKCSICNRTFTRKKQLLAHMQKVIHISDSVVKN